MGLNNVESVQGLFFIIHILTQALFMNNLMRKNSSEIAESYVRSVPYIENVQIIITVCPSNKTRYI